LSGNECLAKPREPSLSGEWFTLDPAAKGQARLPSRRETSWQSTRVTPESRACQLVSRDRPFRRNSIRLSATYYRKNRDRRFGRRQHPDSAPGARRPGRQTFRRPSRRNCQIDQAGVERERWPDNETGLSVFNGTAAVFPPRPSQTFASAGGKTADVPRTRGPGTATPALDGDFSFHLGSARCTRPATSRAVTDSPAEQKLIEQFQSRESAAAEQAAKIRTLQASGPGERNDDSERELRRQLRHGVRFEAPGGRAPGERTAIPG